MKKYDQIHPDEGIKKLLELDVNTEIEQIPLIEGLNRVIAEDLYATFNVPSFNKSPYDGYAIRGEDTIGASRDNPVEFKVIEEIPAGYYPKKEINKMEASKILTGGAVPKGANVCIKFEDTEFTDDTVKVFSEVKPNKDIIKAGEDTKLGSLLVGIGKVLTPGILGQLSSQGITKINVYKKPLVGLFTTGHELKSPGEELQPGQIYDSNNITFKSILENMGFKVKIYGILEDDLEKIEEFTKLVIDEVDLLITTGGASVGDYDFALTSIKNLGGEVLFWKTAMKPGGSIVVSRLKDKTVLGLSGNPGAAVLGMYRSAYPYLRKVLGMSDLYPKQIDVILKKDLNKKSPRVRILRGSLEYIDGKVYFQEKDEQGNGVLSSFIDCDAFAEIPAGSEEVKAGTILKAYKVGSIFGSVGE